MVNVTDDTVSRAIMNNCWKRCITSTAYWAPITLGGADVDWTCICVGTFLVRCIGGSCQLQQLSWYLFLVHIEVSVHQLFHLMLCGMVETDVDGG